MLIRPCRSADETAIVPLWEECGQVPPQNDPRKEIARQLRANPECGQGGERRGRSAGTVVLGDRSSGFVRDGVISLGKRGEFDSR